SYFHLHDTPTTHLYTLSLHDALPILDSPAIRTRPSWIGFSTVRCRHASVGRHRRRRRSRGQSLLPTRFSRGPRRRSNKRAARTLDRKSTRLNSSHVKISYAVFCLKKK